MTNTWGAIKKWHEDPLEQLVSDLKEAYERIVGMQDELWTAATPKGWTGKGGDAARATAKRLYDEAETQAAETAALRTASADAADRVAGLRRATGEAERLAESHGFAIRDDGSVDDVDPPRDVPEDQVERVRMERVRFRLELGDRVGQALRQADDIDADYATILDKIANGTVSNSGRTDNDTTTLAAAGNTGEVMGNVMSTLAPPSGDGVTVAASAGWWASLSEADRKAIIKDHPNWIGNRDGIPGQARHEANLARVEGERQRLREQRDNVKGQLGELNRHDTEGRFELKDRLNEIERKLDSLDKIDKMTLDRNGDPLSDRQLLVLDVSSGERARAAVASGNVDTAEHVAVFTPGMNSTVGDMDGYVKDMAEVRGHAEELLTEKESDSSVATVTWLDYEPPQVSVEEISEGVSADRARDGASRLHEFYNGIGASRNDDPHITAAGHSYGSVATGLALSYGPAVDDSVVFGAPGLGQDPAMMDFYHGDIYNMENWDDPITYGDVHGKLSTSPEVEQLSTGKAATPGGDPLAAGSGHGGYVDADGKQSTAEYNLAAVIAGHSELAVRE